MEFYRKSTINIILILIVFSIRNHAYAYNYSNDKVFDQVYVVKYSKKGSSEYGNMVIYDALNFTDLSFKNSYVSWMPETIDEQSKKGYTFYSITGDQGDNYENWSFYILTDKKIKTIILNTLDDGDKFRNNSQHKDMYDKGYSLFSCSDRYSKGERVSFFSYKPNENMENVYLIEGPKEPGDYNVYVDREDFFKELASFNSKGEFYPDSSEEYIKLGIEKKRTKNIYKLPSNDYTIFNLEFCNKKWMASFTKNTKFKGNNYLYRASGYQDLKNKVDTYKKKEVYLVDVENGDVYIDDPTTMSNTKTMWIAIFSDNPIYKNSIIFKDYPKVDLLLDDLPSMGDKGMQAVDMAIGYSSGKKMSFQELMLIKEVMEYKE